MSVYHGDDLCCFKQSLNSLLKQSYEDYILCIIFDGPISLNIEKFITNLKDKRLRIIRRSNNKGLAKSLNELLNIVLIEDDCDYIARMDADDISLPLRFEKQIKFLEINEDIDCVGTWAIEIQEDGAEYFRKKMPVSHEECLNLFRKRDCLIHPSVMFRKSYFEKAGLYPEDTYFGEDTIMWAQGFASGCRFANIPEYLFKFRLDADFFNRRRGIKHAQSILSLRKRVSKMLGFGLKEDIYSYFYALVKLMPVRVLNIVYKLFR